MDSPFITGLMNRKMNIFRLLPMEKNFMRLKVLNPLNKYSTVRKSISMQKLGPGYTFSKEMIKLRPEKKNGLIVNVKGGTSIEKWVPGGFLYNEAVNQTKKAIKYGVLKGIVWHQGESGASNYKAYMPKMVRLITSLRKDLGSPNLPFVAGQLSPDKMQRNGFNKMILELPNNINNTGLIVSNGTSTIDSTHFDSASQRLLGIRYAEAMVKLNKN